MAALLPATVCMTTAVELLISAVTTVLSTLSTSTPVSSTNAPRVPEPSSREMTVIDLSALNSAQATEAMQDSASAAQVTILANFFIVFLLFLLSTF